MSLINFFFFNDTATTEIYTLSLHDALPICRRSSSCVRSAGSCCGCSTRSTRGKTPPLHRDRKSTRLNSSHSQISYAVFCLKKKKNTSQSVDMCQSCTSSERTNSVCCLHAYI